MKFTSLVMLVASASAAGPADWDACIQQNCSSTTYVCCNLITKSYSNTASAGSMICADPTTANRIIPAAKTNGGGRFVCSTTQLLKSIGAINLAASGAVAAAVSALYLM